MSDRSYFTLIIYAVPDDITEEQRGQIDDLFLENDINGSGEVEDGTLVDHWTCDEMLLDSYQTVAASLIEINPGFTFACWNDPKYEWLGGLTMYAPDLGLWQGDCDAEGNPVFKARQVVGIFGGNDNDDPLSLLGIPWLDRFDQIENS